MYAVYINNEDSDGFELFQDEFKSAVKGEESFMIMKIFPTEKQAWKYIIQLGYSDDEVEVKKVEVREQ